MGNRRQAWCSTFRALSLLVLPASTWGQAPGQPVSRNLAEVRFAPIPGLPTCALASVQNGDPAKEASIILAKVPAGCVIPWHWHGPHEHVMIVSGVAHIEVKDGKPLTMRAGGFVQMPSHHVHQFRCTSPCLFYLYSDAAFDIHYVNGQGTEISPDEALRAVKETAAKPPMN